MLVSTPAFSVIRVFVSDPLARRSLPEQPNTPPPHALVPLYRPPWFMLSLSGGENVGCTYVFFNPPVLWSNPIPPLQTFLSLQYAPLALFSKAKPRAAKPRAERGMHL